VSQTSASIPVGGDTEPAKAPLHLSLDGSMVPLLDGWLLAIGERQADEPLTALRDAATLGTAEAFGDEAVGELVRRELPGSSDIVTVTDGAAWIQGCLDLPCPRRRVSSNSHMPSALSRRRPPTRLARERLWPSAGSPPNGTRCAMVIRTRCSPLSGRCLSGRRATAPWAT
jgi:hypothetical protein